MKYKELTEQQINDLIRESYRFSTEEMSIEDAIDLFQPRENGKIYRSYHLLESIVPKEYLKEKEFIKAIIPTRYPFTYASVLEYADSELKNDRELVDFCIEEHGFYAIFALSSEFGIEDKNRLEQAKNDKNVYIEPVLNSAGELIRYRACSKLLRDEDFVKSVLDKAEKENDPSLVESLMKYSSLCSSNIDFAKRAIKIAPDSISHASETLFEDEQFVAGALKTLIEQPSQWRTEVVNKKIKGEQLDNKNVQKLIKTCSKLSELPENAKLRNAIYKKMANHYLEELKIDSVENATTLEA